jgi:hypothetical protein
MATRPPAPPPRGPQFIPPDGGRNTAATVIKLIAYVFGVLVVLLVVGAGLLVAVCTRGR